MYFLSTYDAPFGKLYILSDEKALKGLWIEGQQHFMSGFSDIEVKKGENTVTLKTKEWLDRYFAGDIPDPRELPLAPDGTEFRLRVWSRILSIPYGRTMTYGEIADWLGIKGAQAVGNAVGCNPISIVIPCHRVVGFKGDLTGYAAGVEVKKFLLEHENGF